MGHDYGAKRLPPAIPMPAGHIVVVFEAIDIAAGFVQLAAQAPPLIRGDVAVGFRTSLIICTLCLLTPQIAILAPVQFSGAVIFLDAPDLVGAARGPINRRCRGAGSRCRLPPQSRDA